MIVACLILLALLYLIVGCYVVGGSGGFLRGFSFGTLFLILVWPLFFIFSPFRK
jgi:hypothetical protein